MTTLAVLSDIHGVWPALKAVLEDLAQFPVDRVLVSGDLISLGPFSRQVVACAVESGWVVIRGNNEHYLLDYGTPRAPKHWQDSTQFAMLAWLERQFDDELKRTIATWPDTLQLRFHDAPSVRLVHGSVHSAHESMYPCTPDGEIEKALAGTREHVVVAGHTHLPMQRTVGQWQILNPGSVGVPLDGRFSASYMLLEGTGTGWRSTFRRVPFDVRPVLREFERQGFVEECGVIGYLVAETFRAARPHVMPFLRWRDQKYPDEPLSNEMLDDYLLTATWEQYVQPAYLMTSRECDRVPSLEYNRSQHPVMR